MLCISSDIFNEITTEDTKGHAQISEIGLNSNNTSKKDNERKHMPLFVRKAPEIGFDMVNILRSIFLKFTTPLDRVSYSGRGRVQDKDSWLN